MGRHIEYIRKSEARIMVYLDITVDYMRTGRKMSDKLKIDYIYLMKLLGQMYDKGWVQTRVYHGLTLFTLSAISPLEEAKERLAGKEEITSSEMIKQKKKFEEWADKQ